ncbi:hypothetical protein KDA_72330 [Dictyobacter alpinus]|uniref:Zinc finger CGNR domain-containing protein n=1 Tax=Dictyobacter alpinus TaxID=2014873 RepID=A0A402BK72_9CHLR|nr:ABATE domain-containing protein [Dictyobacter alpinus]GCE31749.1 hypothetical protein KDA_72330 [Dictyobacter alpinus]
MDFTNTVDPRIGNSPREFLTNYADLARWSLYVGVLDESEAERLLQCAEQQPEEAASVFERAIVLREVLYRTFAALAHNLVPEPADLDLLKTAFVEAMTPAQLIPTTHGLQWDWTARKNELEQMLWPVVRSAIELLTTPEEIKRVKECPGINDCGWLFLDTSKNGSRQWCSMEGCGSRAKMRRQYARKRSGKPQRS